MEKMLISDLRPYEKNARKHSPEQVAKLRNSIRDFGFLNPVIVDENNMILESSSEIAIDGHAIGSCSDENDLGETGYKFKFLKGIR